MPTNSEVREFYDGFLPRLATENARHRRIYQSLDLLPKGKTLDIGCGAGLTSHRLAEGGRDVVAIDFSPAAIEFARRNRGHERIQYVCTDISSFKTKDFFDAICLVDVLEHLDSATQYDVFRIISTTARHDAVVYVNVPYSETIRYLEKNHPDALQPIDRPLDIGWIIEEFDMRGFVPFGMELFWMQYVEFFFCKKEQFKAHMDRAFQSLKKE